ncbi:Gfo/Idh/MocA family protein [Tropicimonas sp. S265A]|uniref:Gfo/Idh/MocA family protein n=1 Tax=Tropicimonas sp. S265A TaxID=3415134 RepID=UPI003C7E8CC1
MKTIRWGILGASRFASTTMGPAIHSARGAVLDAVATRTPAKAALFDFCPDIRVHDSYDALLADPQIDAVYVPLPHTLHVPWGVKALHAGKPVLIEKPLALRAADIDPLVAAQAETGLLAAEAYMIVHHPQWHRVRALIQSGAIGEILQIDGTFTYDNRSDPGNIRNRAETGGGGLPDVGVYPMGAARYALAAEPTITSAQIKWEDGVDATAQVRAGIAGAQLNILVSMRMAKRQSMTFHGTDGEIHMPAPFNPGSFAEAQIHLSDANGLRVERFPGVDHYILQVEAFGAALRGEAPFPWSLADATGTQTALDAVYAVANPPV